MIVFDMEATSLDHNKGAMLSLGAVDLLDPTRTYYKEYRIWEGALVEDEALAVAGFNREQIQDQQKPLFKEAAQELIEWIQKSKSQILAGHNVMFDIQYLKAELNRAGIDWPLGHRSVDLHAIAFAKNWAENHTQPLREDGHSDMGLGNVAKYTGFTINRGTAHNALEDAKVTAECFSRLILDKKLFSEYDHN